MDALHEVCFADGLQAFPVQASARRVDHGDDAALTSCAVTAQHTWQHLFSLASDELRIGDVVGGGVALGVLHGGRTEVHSHDARRRRQPPCERHADGASTAAHVQHERRLGLAGFRCFRSLVARSLAAFGFPFCGLGLGLRLRLGSRVGCLGLHPASIRLPFCGFGLGLRFDVRASRLGLRSVTLHQGVFGDFPEEHLRALQVRLEERRRANLEDGVKEPLAERGGGRVGVCGDAAPVELHDVAFRGKAHAVVALDVQAPAGTGRGGKSFTLREYLINLRLELLEDDAVGSLWLWLGFRVRIVAFGRCGSRCRCVGRSIALRLHRSRRIHSLGFAARQRRLHDAGQPCLHLVPARRKSSVLEAHCEARKNVARLVARAKRQHAQEPGVGHVIIGRQIVCAHEVPET
mmetsp:Transcript_42682/g.133789  ORF Transcript_42682/g.133789 Transcript_42682/m.133789 type:complete len:406 (-) Transcript_42682:746-1963(-)